MAKGKGQLTFDDVDGDATPAEPDPVDAWMGNRKPRPQTGLRRGPPKASTRVVEEYVAEATQRANTGNWEGATKHHLVALYVVCHHRVYGMRPLEVNGETWHLIANTAGNLLTGRFNNSVEDMVAYMHWTWNRERNRRDYQARRAKELGGTLPDVKRIGWRLQFGSTSPMLTDYMVARQSSD